MSDILHSGLREPTTALAYTIGRTLREHLGDRAVIEASGCSFGLERFAWAGLCSLVPKPTTHAQMVHSYCGPDEDDPESGGISVNGSNVWFDVHWEGHDLEVVQASWAERYMTQQTCWIVAASEELAKSFYTRVCQWTNEVRGEVLVFDGGSWFKSTELYRSIRNATFDNLILKGQLKSDILNDLRHFFNSRSTYERYKVPWKRGILMIGPPGNGKTHTVKALINALEQPCLYVKSFKTQHGTDHDCIRSVFGRARKTVPCLLVLEDLDSIIDAGNRSYFLNELDGFQANTGIVALATTNHPERLDRSIIERPSRFDRKYHFELPEDEERRAYAQMWNASLEAELQLTVAGLEQIVAATSGFSFAYLKELFLSATMEWMVESRPGSMDALMESQVAALRSQMESLPDEEPNPSEVGSGMSQARLRAMMARLGLPFPG